MIRMWSSSKTMFNGIFSALSDNAGSILASISMMSVWLTLCLGEHTDTEFILTYPDFIQSWIVERDKSDVRLTSALSRRSFSSDSVTSNVCLMVFIGLILTSGELLSYESYLLMEDFDFVSRCSIMTSPCNQCLVWHNLT